MKTVSLLKPLIKYLLRLNTMIIILGYFFEFPSLTSTVSKYFYCIKTPVIQHTEFNKWILQILIESSKANILKNIAMKEHL